MCPNAEGHLRSRITTDANRCETSRRERCAIESNTAEKSRRRYHIRVIDLKSAGGRGNRVVIQKLRVGRNDHEERIRFARSAIIEVDAGAILGYENRLCRN